ncbi:hypothetical protein MTQ01_08055 [Streptomyces sp. XM4193]|uniref:hypothetical protein n=1 Tax=Streptomyces sp. XM4193 TaxID=2929782 RepID=UPI001FFA1544|nr:hypothetical protein [Streptomyces sp. XM4193]MCK1795956.1 hypothetical protein [Streptomyces sp. XM4193]
MGYRHSQQDSHVEEDSGHPHESGLADARREAARLADYLQSGPPRATADREPEPPQLLLRNCPIPSHTLSVYAIGQAVVLRGIFTQADLLALRRAFPGQLVTLDDDSAHHTLVVWPPRPQGPGTARASADPGSPAAG